MELRRDLTLHSVRRFNGGRVALAWTGESKQYTWLLLYCSITINVLTLKRNRKTKAVLVIQGINHLQVMDHCYCSFQSSEITIFPCCVCIVFFKYLKDISRYLKMMCSTVYTTAWCKTYFILIVNNVQRGYYFSIRAHLSL